jgi:L-threonylcarbamoyladenylate synthase
MNIIDIENPNSIMNATKILKNGGILIFPTDTVYGIGCLMIDSAIKKLYKIKNRPANQPTAILISRDLFDAKRKSELIIEQFEQEKDYFEGRLTIVDDIKNYAIDFPAQITKDETIGIRLPNHAWLESLINEVGPIVATSANLAGEKTPENFNELSSQIIKKVDLVVESHAPMSRQPSSILVLSTGLKLR